MISREEIEVRFADRFGGIFEPERAGMRLVNSDEAALEILEVDDVRAAVHHRSQKVALPGQRLLGKLALGHFPEHALNASQPAAFIVPRHTKDLQVAWFSILLSILVTHH